MINKRDELIKQLLEKHETENTEIMMKTKEEIDNIR